VERSTFDHLETVLDLPDRTTFWKPGERFSDRTDAWIEPRILRVDRTRSKPGEEFEHYTFAFVCYLKTLQKGERFLQLSDLADAVRDAVDYTQAARPVLVRDDTDEVVAILEWGPASETRRFDQTVSPAGVAIPGVDLVTIAVRCQLTRGTCP